MTPDVMTEPGEPLPNCPRCHGSGREDNAQFACMCRWHTDAGCPLLRLVGDCNCEKVPPRERKENHEEVSDLPDVSQTSKAGDVPDGVPLSSSIGAHASARERSHEW